MDCERIWRRMQLNSVCVFKLCHLSWKERNNVLWQECYDHTWPWSSRYILFCPDLFYQTHIIEILLPINWRCMDLENSLWTPCFMWTSFEVYLEERTFFFLYDCFSVRIAVLRLWLTSLKTLIYMRSKELHILLRGPFWLQYSSSLCSGKVHGGSEL